MSLGRQAKTLSKGQIEAVLGFMKTTRHPVRNRVIFLLSVRAGLRAREIALLTWEMITDAAGEIGRDIHLQDKASKGKSGRIIPINGTLRESLEELRKLTVWKRPSPFVVSTERSIRTSPQVIVNLLCRTYEHLGFTGCSSHSGRRTFLTNAARKISLVGGSLRDVQILAGHTSLRTTQRYLDADAEAQRKVVELV